MFDYSKLRGKIREVCKTEGAFARQIQISSVTLTSKLNGKSDFTQRQIIAAANVLGLTDDEIPRYFFSTKT